ncbi:MAG: AsmA family protein, partial [Halofilum sp. (in: g-proteobacteria)]
MIARWLKRIGLTLVVLVIVVVGALAAALLLVDTEALKSRIEGRVLAETGRELNIEGPLEISVFPWVGFELGPTRLANAPGFGERDFVALNHAELRVRVLPLLQREIVLDTVVLHGARVNAARNAQGRTNWADLLERRVAAGEEEETARPESPPAESPAAPAANEGPALQFRVEGVDLRDARLSWRDAQNNRELVFDDLDLS